MPTDLITNLEFMIFGGLIIFFLIVEPHGLARLWQIAKEKLRLWPFPYYGLRDPAADPIAQRGTCCDGRQLRQGGATGDKAKCGGDVTASCSARWP